jgi:UDP-3-O-[3-hydroxymyristoyl] glucosamine N-acyltransferase
MSERRKYEMTNESRTVQLLDGRKVTVFRIRALRDIPRHGVKAGELGGWVESEANLAQEGACWIDQYARVVGGATVIGNALIAGQSQVYDKAQVRDNAKVTGQARVFGKAVVAGNASVLSCAVICDQAMVMGKATVDGYADIAGEARVDGYAEIAGKARVAGYAEIAGKARVAGYAEIAGEARVAGYAVVTGNARVTGKARLLGNARVMGDAWVYDSAVIGENACISGYAHVFGSAHVSQCAAIMDNAQVSGFSRIHGDVTVEDFAVVTGHVTLSGSAHVGGRAEINVQRDDHASHRLYLCGDIQIKDKARIRSQRDILSISPVGSEGGTLTAYVALTKEGRAYVHLTRGCFSGTLSEFKDALRAGQQHKELRKIYKKLIPIIEEHFAPSLSELQRRVLEGLEENDDRAELGDCPVYADYADIPRLTPPKLPPVPDATTTTTGTLVVKMTEPPKQPARWWSK